MPLLFITFTQFFKRYYATIKSPLDLIFEKNLLNLDKNDIKFITYKE